MHFNTFHYKNKSSKGRKQSLYIQIMKKYKISHRPQWGGLMYELFPVRCMVSPNEVEEAKVWTGYSYISSKHYSNTRG